MRFGRSGRELYDVYATFRTVPGPPPASQLGCVGRSEGGIKPAQIILSSFRRPTRHAQRESVRSRVVGRAFLANTLVPRFSEDLAYNLRRLFTTFISLYAMLSPHIAPAIALLFTLQTVSAWPSLSGLSPWPPWVRRSASTQTNKLQKRANQTVWISSDTYRGENFFE